MTSSTPDGIIEACQNILNTENDDVICNLATNLMGLAAIVRQHQDNPRVHTTFIGKTDFEDRMS